MYSRFFILTLCSLAAIVVSAHDTKFDNKENTISVTGSGRRSYKNSIAVVRLGVEASGQTAVAVQSTLARESSRLSEFLGFQKVDKLKTSGVSLSVQRDWKVKPAKIVGYTGRNTVSFEVPVKASGAVLDGAVKNGATQISGIYFKASPAASANARKAAIRDAVMNAKMEAEIAVSTLGNSLGAPKQISITDTFRPEATSAPRQQFSQAGKSISMEAAAPASQLSGGEGDVSARVSITFNISGEKNARRPTGRHIQPNYRTKTSTPLLTM